MSAARPTTRRPARLRLNLPPARSRPRPTPGLSTPVVRTAATMPPPGRPIGCATRWLGWRNDGRAQRKTLHRSPALFKTGFKSFAVRCGDVYGFELERIKKACLPGWCLRLILNRDSTCYSAKPRNNQDRQSARQHTGFQARSGPRPFGETPSHTISFHLGRTFAERSSRIPSISRLTTGHNLYRRVPTRRLDNREIFLCKIQHAQILFQNRHFA